MRISPWVIGLAVVHFHGGALAQVFYDDFNGNALQPHWLLPPPWAPWQYNVSNSMLNVERLLYPSNPKVLFNWAFIGAIFAPITSDFVASVRMGWESGEQGAVFFSLSTPEGGGVAQFGFGGNALFAQSSSQNLQFAAPPAGMYEFSIARVGNELGFSINGALLGSLIDSSVYSAGSITLGFHEHNLMPSPGALHVDRVRVVPGPSGFGLVILAALVRSRRRRPPIWGQSDSAPIELR